MIIKDFGKYIEQASKSDYIIPGFNVFGYEYAIGVIDAAEKLKTPTLLMLNKLAVNYMDIEIWGKMLRRLAEKASVPVGVHLDHNSDPEIIKRAIDSGFTSVMYDGSQLPIEENIKNTHEISKLTKKHGIFLEAEIGSVPYNDMPGKIKDELTTAAQAERFAVESGCDWLAIAVGNIHRLVNDFAPLDFIRLNGISEKVDIPLVIHGATGICQEDMEKLTKTQVGKVNIGTSLRTAFVSSLRSEIIQKPDELDSIKLFYEPAKAVSKTVQDKIRMLKSMNKYEV